MRAWDTLFRLAIMGDPSKLCYLIGSASLSKNTAALIGRQWGTSHGVFVNNIIETEMDIFSPGEKTECFGSDVPDLLFNTDLVLGNLIFMTNLDERDSLRVRPWDLAPRLRGGARDHGMPSLCRPDSSPILHDRQVDEEQTHARKRPPAKLPLSINPKHFPMADRDCYFIRARNPSAHRPAKSHSDERSMRAHSLRIMGARK